MAMFTFLRFLELFDLGMSQWVAQALLEINFLMVPMTVPLWIWILIEYHLERKTSFLDKRILPFLIHPVVLIVVTSTQMVSSGFVSQESATALIQPEERLGAYSQLRLIYGWSSMLLLIVVTSYVMLKKQQTSVWVFIQVVLYTSLPFIFFALYHHEVVNMRLAGPALVFYLYWINRQYRLLDVMPVALRGIIDQVDSGMLVTDIHSRLLYVNDYASKLFDLSPQRLQQHGSLVPEAIRANFDASIPKKQTAQIALEDKHNANEMRYLDSVLKPIFHPKSKRHLGATLSLYDVTERKNAEIKLQNFDRQKSEFFAGISHEFRTPLTLSLGNLQDVLNNADHISAHELKNTLGQVKNNNQRLLNLVNQLLELSKLNAGSLKIQPRLLPLAAWLPPLLANFESLANQQNIRIHLQFDQQTTHDPQIYFDADAFEKVIVNLISNALKSMPKGGDIYVRLNSVDDQHLQLSIRDTGCGIPADTLPKIFEMFYSHHSDNAAWPQGVGVGLSLVKKLLTQHGADIEVSSIEAKGTTFTVTLRRGFAHFSADITVDCQVNTEGNSSINTVNLAQLEDETGRSVIDNTKIDNTKALSGFEQKNPHNVSRKRVLLVEDNAEMRAYIRKHLAKDFDLLEAANGQDALALALQTMPDLVLSDVMMPKMNGYELCKRLKSTAETSHIPVLLLTAKSSQAEKIEGLELGADDYLGKPFDAKELILRMSNLIISRRVIKQLYQSDGLQQVIDNQELPKRETTFLDNLQKYVQENISNTDIKILDLAKTVNMSERSLSRKLKVLTGDTPKRMLLHIRLEHATKLLRLTSDSITQLSYRAGFSDASHFTRCFKARYSMTPTAYRKMQTTK